MKRLTNDEILLIRELVLRKLSLNEIAIKLDKSKTTIYYHFLKFKGRTNIPISINYSDEELVGEFIGLFAGDGSYFNSSERGHLVRFHFSLSEKPFVEDLFKNLFLKLINRKPAIYYCDNRLDLHIISKPLITFIKKYLEWDSGLGKTYSIKLKDKIYSREFKIGFLRGSIDSDGHFTNKRASFASVSEKLIEDISAFLHDLNIYYSKTVYIDKRKNRQPLHQIRIKCSCYNKFAKIVNPRNKVQYQKHLKMG